MAINVTAEITNIIAKYTDNTNKTIPLRRTPDIVFEIAKLLEAIIEERTKC